MGWIDRVSAGALCALLACGCSSVPDERGGRSRAHNEGAARLTTTPPENPYDAQGRLRPSGVRVGWLDVPMGFRESRMSRPRHHVYEAHGVPIDKVRDFLNERMLTGQAEPLGRGVRYSAVVPVSAGRDAVRFDVALDVMGHDGLVLSIDELNYVGIKPLPVDQAKGALAREQTQAE